VVLSICVEVLGWLCFNVQYAAAECGQSLRFLAQAI